MLPRFAASYLKDRLHRPTALLTIDVQRAFFVEDGALVLMGLDNSPMRAALPYIHRLHQEARRADVPLVHIRSEGRPWLNWPRHVAPPTMVERIVKAGPGLSFLEPGTRDVDFADEARPGPNEPVITKHVIDAFNGTPLRFALRTLGAETLLIAGLTTECCVETTARSALCHGFAPVVVEDAVASADPDLHRASLKAIAELVGIVASTEEVIELGGWAR